MNIAKVSKTAAIVNYVKPGLEMVEIEVEGAILGTSGGSGWVVGPPGGGTDTGGGQTGPADLEGIGEGSLSSSRPRTRRR
jgi:hypothetical protein